MTGVQAFRSGVRTATTSPALVFTLYVVNLLLAIPLAVGFRFMIGAAFGSSLAAESLTDGLDLTMVREILATSGDAFRALFWSAIPLAILGMFVNAILAGGILTILLREEAFSLKAFFGGMGTMLGRFTRLWLIMLLIGAAVFFLLTILFGMISGNAINSDSGRTAVLGTLGALCVYAPMIIVVMASDYAKIHLVAFDHRSALKAAGLGFLFVLKNPGGTLLLQFLLLLLFGMVVILYWVIENALGIAAPSAYILLFVLQQIVIGARMWIRTAAFAGASLLFDERKPRPVTFYGWDDSPAQEPA